VAKSLFRRLWRPKPQYAQIGKHRIRLAVDSQWPHYRKKFHLYDAALGPIAAVIHAKYPELRAIDIGANVGDTAALIRESAEIPILCIEGDPVLLPILTENAARLGPGVVIEPSFVGPEGAAVNLQSATDLGRNTSLVQATDAHGSTKLRTLRAILADHPEFRSAKLLKSDTEGFDFDILRQSQDFIGQSKPVIYFEYDPHFHPNQPRAGLDAIAALIAAGYSEFMYYDNFGNFLLHADASNAGVFTDLDSYLASNQRHGIAVYYFDVCAVHRDDADLVAPIKSTTQR
jgi:FkbM family methyltransferase